MYVFCLWTALAVYELWMDTVLYILVGGWGIFGALCEYNIVGRIYDLKILFYVRNILIFEYELWANRQLVCSVLYSLYYTNQ